MNTIFESRKSEDLSNTEDLLAQTNSKRNPQARKSAAVDNLNKAKKLKDWLFFYLGKLYSIGKFDRTPHRSAILRAHYSWTSQLFLLMFSYCASSWYGEVPIRCFEMYDLQRATPEIEDVCVQFPYTTNKSHPHVGGEKYYAPYYMWVHWLCLLLFMVYQAVHAAIFFTENKVFRSFIHELESTYDYFQRIKKTKEYYQKNFGVHNGMVRNCIFLNMFALLVNLFVFYGVDALLINKYWSMPWYLTVTRDCVFFDDPFSLLFPPFAYCDFTPDLHIQVGRHQLFGCELPLNETYAKFFMALWFWQVLLALWSFCSIFYWIHIYTSKSSSKDLLYDGCYKRFPQVKQAAKKLNVDEALALSIIKPCLYAPHYRALIESISTWDPCDGDLKMRPAYYNPNFPDILENIPIVEENEREQDTIENFFVAPVSDPSTIVIGKTDDDNEESESSDDPPKKSNDKNDGDSKNSKDKDKNKKVAAKPTVVATETVSKPRHPEGWSFPLKAFLAVHPTSRARQMIPLPALKHNIGRYKEHSVSDPYLSVAESPEPQENLLNSSCCSSIDLPPTAPEESALSKNKKGIQKSNSSADKKPTYISDRKTYAQDSKKSQEKSSIFDKKSNQPTELKPSAPEVEPDDQGDWFDNEEPPKEETQQDFNQVGGNKKRNKKKK